MTRHVKESARVGRLDPKSPEEHLDKSLRKSDESLDTRVTQLQKEQQAISTRLAGGQATSTENNRI